MIRARLLEESLALALAFAIGAPSAFALDGDAIPVVYSSSGDDGVCVASKDAWYFEEYDGLSRPVSGVLWKAGEIAERTSWTYQGDGQQAFRKIVTAAGSSVIYEYDAFGNTLKTSALNAKGDITESTANEYDADGNLTLTVHEKGSDIERIELSYENGEQKEKRVFRNGEPVMLWQSTGKNDWTESMYYEGAVILVVEYANGVRKERP